MNDSILRQLRRLPNISLLLFQQSFPLLHEAFDNRPKQVISFHSTSYHPVVRHDQTHSMQTNHCLCRDDVCCHFCKYGIITNADHDLWRLQEEFKQPFEVSLIVEVLEVIGSHQSFRSNLRTSAGGEPHLGWISPESSELGGSERHLDVLLLFTKNWQKQVQSLAPTNMDRVPSREFSRRSVPIDLRRIPCGFV